MIVKKMYADDPQDAEVIKAGFTSKAMLIVLAIMIIAFGLCQRPLVDLADWAAGTFF